MLQSPKNHSTLFFKTVQFYKIDSNECKMMQIATEKLLKNLFSNWSSQLCPRKHASKRRRQKLEKDHKSKKNICFDFLHSFEYFEEHKSDYERLYCSEKTRKDYPDIRILSVPDNEEVSLYWHSWLNVKISHAYVTLSRDSETYIVHTGTDTVAILIASEVSEVPGRKYSRNGIFPQKGDQDHNWLLLIAFTDLTQSYNRSYKRKVTARGVDCEVELSIDMSVQNCAISRSVSKNYEIHLKMSFNGHFNLALFCIQAIYIYFFYWYH